MIFYFVAVVQTLQCVFVCVCVSVSCVSACRVYQRVYVCVSERVAYADAHVCEYVNTFSCVLFTGFQKSETEN